MNKMFRNIIIAVAIMGIAATAFMCTKAKQEESSTDSTAVVSDSAEAVASDSVSSDSSAAQ